MIRKTRNIITSTHLDKQGYVMAKSALESMLPQLNGDRKPRLGLEHIRIFPPLGAIMNGEIFKGEGLDEHYYLSVEMCYFDKQEVILLEDGTQLLKESFSEGVYPFLECAETETNKLRIGTDPVNFETHEAIEEIYGLVKQESDLEFETELLGRKSELPDPEIIITLTKTLAIALGIIKSKIPEKLGEAIGEDLVKFYRLVSKLSYEAVKKVKPANRPKNFVISYPNSECNIELVITTYKHDEVLNSLTKEKLQDVADKTERLKNLEPEKIQFIYNENGFWEFNYLLSKSGSAIGSMKSFKKRNELYNQILQQQSQEQKGG
jgi:hypothetical protein